MPETEPTTKQILAEWSVNDPEADLQSWMMGQNLYESASLNDSEQMMRAASLMCSGLAHHTCGNSLFPASASESSDAQAAHTVWKVLVATLYCPDAPALDDERGRNIRLALVAARMGQYQSQDLGGTGLMAEIFDDAGYRLEMSGALLDSPAIPHVSALHLAGWFAEAKPKPSLVLPPTVALSDPDLASEKHASQGLAAITGHVKTAKDSINPKTLQHGLESIQGALTAAQIAKIDKKTGKLKLRKVGTAKAALRPRKTIKRAIDGASLTQHLKAITDESDQEGD